MQKAGEPEDDAGFLKHIASYSAVVIHTPLSLDYSGYSFLGYGISKWLLTQLTCPYRNSACEPTLSVEPPVQMQSNGSLGKPVQVSHVQENPLTQSNQHDNTNSTSLSFEKTVSGSNMIFKFDQQEEGEGSERCYEMISETD